MGCDEDVGRILIIIRNMGKRRIKMWRELTIQIGKGKPESL